MTQLLLYVAAYEESTPKSRYSVSRNSEFRDIVNKSQLPSYFTKYINLI